jgi:hypothetical protein
MKIAASPRPIPRDHSTRGPVCAWQQKVAAAPLSAAGRRVAADLSRALLGRGYASLNSRAVARLLNDAACWSGLVELEQKGLIKITARGVSLSF